MDLSFFMQLCGGMLFVSLLLTAVTLAIAACGLVFVVKREDLLAAFLPLTLTPIAIAATAVFVDLVSSIATQLDSDTIAVDSALLLQMNLAPLMLGLVASIPAASITALGRFLIAIRARGVRLFPKREEADEGPTKLTAEEWVNKEAEDYLEKLVRPR